MMQARGFESGLRLRIGPFTLPLAGAKFFRAAATYGFCERRITVTGEVEEGRRLAILFAHEEQRNKGGEQSGARGKLEAFEVHNTAETIAQRAIPYLIVILRAD